MTSERTLAILGGTGKAGTHIVNEALSQGFHVRAFTRNPGRLPSHERLTAVPGEVADAEAIAGLIQGCEAVISAVGPTNMDQKLAAAMVCKTATQNLIAAMQETGPLRYIVVSAASVVLDTDRRKNLIGLMSQYVAPIMLGDVLNDKIREANLLQLSGLDWTLVRCPIIRDKPAKGIVKVDEQTMRGGSVRAGELARFMIEQVDDATWIKRGVFVKS